MAKRTLISVGYAIPGEDIEYVPLDSEQSLLDADIILFQPGIPSSYYGYGEEEYRGKPTLDQSGSFKAVEQAKHWRAELEAAAEHGKTVVVFLAKPQEAYAYTGQQETSGTGRNQKVTNIVNLYSSYNTLPVTLGMVVPRQGREIVLRSNAGAVAAYWSEFGDSSPYEVYLESDPGSSVLLTKTGSKPVGLLVRSGKGHLVLLPPVQYDEASFTRTEDDGNEYWNEEGVAFGARLVAALIRLDRELRGEGGRTPPPEWATESTFRLVREVQLEEQVSTLTTQIEGLREDREALSRELAVEGGLRRLLYATGAELEEAILEALRAFGYQAENATDDESEFDAVFLSPEGERFLGEAEGKENKALNIDKLSQLERNIQEDFAREDVQEPARGVLFGNAFRLQPPAERADYFTDKCISGARRSGIALVRTPDLFTAVKHLREKADPEYARECRDAISAAKGALVTFPTPDRPS